MQECKLKNQNLEMEVQDNGGSFHEIGGEPAAGKIAQNGKVSPLRRANGDATL